MDAADAALAEPVGVAGAPGTADTGEAFVVEETLVEGDALVAAMGDARDGDDTGDAGDAGDAGDSEDAEDGEDAEDALASGAALAAAVGAALAAGTALAAGEPAAKSPNASANVLGVGDGMVVGTRLSQFLASCGCAQGPWLRSNHSNTEVFACTGFQRALWFLANACKK